MKMLLKKTRCGFTLIELLVVITIIGILAAMLFPVFGKVKENTYRMKCAASCLREVGKGIMMYTTENDGVMPSNNAAVTIQSCLSNYLGNALQILACPSDLASGAKTAWTNGAALADGNCSYTYCASNQMVGAVLTPIMGDRGDQTSNGTWQADSPHKDAGGNILWSDGHVAFQKKGVGLETFPGTYKP